ncbi:fungal-specific transcription factor domain-containing protein [Xylaria digitata]|nr:fungal-specific transcription factor domain-containing protein [Xylaria digitata]
MSLRTSFGCWTCKDRKVRCDGTTPACQRCMRLRRPDKSDKRRSITAGVPGIVSRPSHHHQFVNTSYWDMELYRYISGQTSAEPLSVSPYGLKLLKQPGTQQKHMDLLYYFRDAACHSLLSFCASDSQLRDVLMPMALTHHNMSGCALFFATLAVSSLHRSGLHQQTMQFKTAALRALSASAADAIAGTMTLHTISGDWLWYIRAAMDTVRRARLEQESDQTGITELLDWVYYHHTLSRFALYHLRHKAAAQESSPRPTSPRQICDVLLDPLDPRSRDNDYQAHIQHLQWNVINLPVFSSSSRADPDSIPEAPEPPLPIQMYQRATIVYLLRASQDPLGPSAKLDKIIDRSFTERVKAPSCSHFFPLFILASEARTDDERISVLDSIEKTEKGSPIRNMGRFRAGIQSFRARRDLHADGDLIMSYMDLMKVVVSPDHVPPYV